MGGVGLFLRFVSTVRHRLFAGTFGYFLASVLAIPSNFSAQNKQAFTRGRVGARPLGSQPRSLTHPHARCQQRGDVALKLSRAFSCPKDYSGGKKLMWRLHVSKFPFKWARSWLRSQLRKDSVVLRAGRRHRCSASGGSGGGDVQRVAVLAHCSSFCAGVSNYRWHKADENLTLVSAEPQSWCELRAALKKGTGNRWGGDF